MTIKKLDEPVRLTREEMQKMREEARDMRAKTYKGYPVDLRALGANWSDMIHLSTTDLTDRDMIEMTLLVSMPTSYVRIDVYRLTTKKGETFWKSRRGITLPCFVRTKEEEDHFPFVTFSEEMVRISDFIIDNLNSWLYGGEEE